MNENISFNNNDDNLPQISQNLGIPDNVQLKNQYRIYGAKQEGNPPIVIKFNPDKLKSEQFDDIRELFKKSDLKFDIKPLEDGGDKKFPIYVGLRRDLRDNEKVSLALINTVIYNLEGKLKIKKTDKIKKLPKFD